MPDDPSKWDEWSRAWAARDYNKLNQMFGDLGYDPVSDMAGRVADRLLNRVNRFKEGLWGDEDAVSGDALQEAAKTGAFVPVRNAPKGGSRVDPMVDILQGGDPTERQITSQNSAAYRDAIENTARRAERAGMEAEAGAKNAGSTRADAFDANMEARGKAWRDSVGAIRRKDQALKKVPDPIALEEPLNLRDPQGAKAEIARTPGARSSESGAQVRVSNVREPYRYESALETRFTGSPLKDRPVVPGDMKEMGSRPLPDEAPASRGVARRGGGRGGAVPPPMMAALAGLAGPAAALMEGYAGTRPDGTIIHQSRLLGRPVTRADLGPELLEALDADPEMESFLMRSGFMSESKQPAQPTAADIATQSYVPKRGS